MGGFSFQKKKKEKKEEEEEEEASMRTGVIFLRHPSRQIENLLKFRCTVPLPGLRLYSIS
jgi:hypothetical protein